MLTDIICHHLIDSGFDVHPPWHSFGPIFDGKFGAARLYMGRAREWLGTNRNSEHLVDISFDFFNLWLLWPPGFRESWPRERIPYADPDFFAALYGRLKARADSHHKI